MNERLTQAQLQKLVAEVQRLQDQRQDELDDTQVREILQELNLAPELLPDAMVQLRRREALELEQRRNRWLIGGAIAAIVIVVSGGLAFFQFEQQVFDRIGVQADQVTLQLDDPGRPVTTVTRPVSLEYDITLTQAPIGQTLSLQCDWLDPTGTVVKQNRFTTKVITTDVWQTRCRYALGAGATPGTWRVKLFLGDRELSDATFEVR